MKKKFSLSRKEVPQVIKEGYKFACPLFYVKYLENKDSAKFSFVVPKKLYPKATDRNKLKRRVKESFRINKTMFNNIWCVVFPNKEAMFVNFNDLALEVSKFAESLSIKGN